jgi:hypothetical protein
MDAVFVSITALGLVALPFVSERGPRASLFGWLAFALLLSVARYFRERSIRIDARQRNLDGDAATRLHASQQ